MNNKNILSNQRGFTLIELVITIVLNGIVGVLILIMLTAGFSGLRSIFSVKRLIQEGELGLSKFTRETTLIYRFINVGANIITFKSTLDTTIAITYLLDSDNFWRDIGGGYQLLVDNVNSGTSAFSYYKSDGGAATSFADIRRIRLTLNMQHGDKTIPLTADVFPAVIRFKEN
jgi:prepilin-type N-terminal cleavage/methylation domain-containing protein